MPDDLIKGYACDVSTQEEFPIRGMNADEVKLRNELNIDNTASALRARVIADLAKTNGGSKPT